MNKKSIKLLEQLSNSFGPSGFEREPIKIVRDYIEPYSDSIRFDKLGSLLFTKIGQADELFTVYRLLLTVYHLRF